MAPVVPADLDSVKRLAPGAGYLAVVATTRPDGTVHASVVSAGVLDDPVTGRPAVGMVVGGNTPGYVRLRPRVNLAAILDERAAQALPDKLSGLISKMTVETLNLRPNMLVNVTPVP